MNGDELARNKQLTEYAVRDLNLDPTLPYADNSFDIITNVVSVDYLTRPLEVRDVTWFCELQLMLSLPVSLIFRYSKRSTDVYDLAVWLS